MNNITNKLLKPFTYILQRRGKQVQTKLAEAFKVWLDIPLDKHKIICEIMELQHNAIVLIDDIQDNSKFRRGLPTAHSIYGIPSTITAINYVLLHSLNRVTTLNHPKALSVYIEQIIELYEAQGTEIYWRDNLICPTEEEYKKVATKKATTIFNSVLFLMQLFSGNKTDFTKLIDILGLYYQINDDYCNLCSQSYNGNGRFCDDITEGKFSFPIIHAIQSRPDDREVFNILRQRTDDEALKKYCMALLEQYGSLAYTKEVLAELDREARKEVSLLGGNQHVESMLNDHITWREN